MTKEQKLFAYWLSITLLIGFLAFACSYTPPAECRSCVWSGGCHSDSICGSFCVCVKGSSTDVTGFCARRS